MPDKPVIFISHASKDGKLANALQEQINQIFANSIEVFNSSGDSISLGKDWLNEIENSLSKLTAFVILVTPESIKSRWVWFETGAFWLRSREDSGLFPLVIGIEPKDVPDPIARLQYEILTDEKSIKSFFQALCRRFGSGNLSLLDTSEILAGLEAIRANYNVAAETPIIESKQKATSPYVGYSDGDLNQVIDDYLSETWVNYGLAIDAGAIEPHERRTIFGYELIDFENFDQQLKLPIGTSKRLLKDVAQKYHLYPDHEGEKTIRFTDEREAYHYKVLSILRDFFDMEYQSGNWITYRSLDAQKALEEGTTQTYIKRAADEFSVKKWKIQKETNAGISFTLIE